MRDAGVDEIITGDETKTITLPYTAPKEAKYALERNFTKGLYSSGSTAWIFADLHTSNSDDLRFTILNATNFSVTVWAELFFENTVYVEPDFPNIKYAIDGLNYAIPIEYVSANDFYDIEKYDYDYEDNYFITKAHTMVIGGAYSVDKYHRIANGWSWFENEQLNDEEKQDIKDYLNFLYSKGNNRIDVFLSHTCPCIYEPTDLFLSMIDQSMVDKSMERFLGEIEYRFPYLAWFWGHYHADREYPIGEDNVRRVMLMDKVLDFSSYMTDLIKGTNKTYADYVMNY